MSVLYMIVLHLVRLWCWYNMPAVHWNHRENCFLLMTQCDVKVTTKLQQADSCHIFEFALSVIAKDTRRTPKFGMHHKYQPVAAWEFYL